MRLFVMKENVIVNQRMQTKMNKTHWSTAFAMILMIYIIGFATNLALLVHIAFALALALSFVTLSEVR